MSEPCHIARPSVAVASVEFAGSDDVADVAALIVTHNSALHLETLIASLRREAVDQRIRVIIVDNASTDATAMIAQRHSDITTVLTGENLGYAGGINRALSVAGIAGAYLILNPDLDVEPGCVAALRARLQNVGGGIVTPAITNARGMLTRCLRNEPSISGALADVLLGARARPAWIPSETVTSLSAYTQPHEADWATGAAMLISADAATAVGPWDERFFLYSEETDFCRRARDLGFALWYEPAAVVRHAEGGSGASVDLDRLLTVNRVRYARKHMTRGGAAVFRAVVALNALVRGYDSTHRAILCTVVNERSWRHLPAATGTGA